MTFVALNRIRMNEPSDNNWKSKNSNKFPFFLHLHIFYFFLVNVNIEHWQRHTKFDTFRRCYVRFTWPFPTKLGSLWCNVTITNWTNNKTFHFLIDHDICWRCFCLFSKVRVLILFRCFSLECETVFMAPREIEHFACLKV